MTQKNATRILNDLRMEIQNPANSARQEVLKTGCWRCGDVVEFYDSPDGECLPAVSLGTATIDCLVPDDAFFFTAAIDLSTASGTVIAVNKTLDCQQAFNDRLCDEGNPQNQPYIFAPSIVSTTQDSPVVGQMTVQINDHAECYAAGDNVKIVCDSGIVLSATVLSVNIAQNEIVLDDTVDLTGETNCYLASCCDIYLSDILDRTKNLISGGGQDCEDDWDGDCYAAAFETSQEIVSGTSHVLLDGSLLRRGTAGTRASLSDGAGNSEIVFTSMVLNEFGNSVQVEIVNAAGTAVTVSGTWPNRVVSVNNNSGAATVNDLIAAIHADADARRLVQVTTGGGDGTGVAGALVATNLAGGANDATHDYAEALDENGDLKFLLFNIRPDLRNSLKEPFAESEWLHADYKC